MWFLFRRNPRQTKTVRRTPSTIRPRLEVLEDRCLMSAGALDLTFGNGAGYVTASLTNSNDYGESTVIEPNGTLILCGPIETTRGAKHTYAVGLIAYNPDGSLDTAFGTGGTVIGPANVNGELDSVLYPSTDPNGNGGKFLVTGLSGFAIARYNANGTLDSTFGQAGIATANFGKTLGTAGTYSVIIQPNGKIVVLGESADDSTAELARFNANGSLDTTFGTNGLATVAVRYATALLSQPDSSLVVTGSNTGLTALKMAALNANGTLNTSFGSNGYVTNSLVRGGSGNNGALGVVDPTGKTTDDQIIVIGMASNGGWELARYNPDGTLDTTFGDGGMVHPLSTGWGANVTIQPDDKIVAVGAASYPTAIGVARFNTDGSLDSTFGTGGIVTTQIGTGLSVLNEPAAISLQPNGDILVAGKTYDGSKWNFALVRYLPSEPEIGSFTANPNPVTSGSNLTLTASNITDGNPNSTITQVTFYYFDATGNKVVLGTGTPDSSGDWSLTFTVNLAAGSYTLYAQAEDNYGVLGDPDALSLTVQ